MFVAGRGVFVSLQIYIIIIPNVCVWVYLSFILCFFVCFGSRDLSGMEVGDITCVCVCV